MASISDIRVLLSMPRHEDARKLLDEIASRVQPILTKHKLKVDLLSEFCPKEEAGVMGLNVSYGRNIKLRLRKAHKQDEFIPINNIMDTMLHQLCHNYSCLDPFAFKYKFNIFRKEYDDHMGKSSCKEYDVHMIIGCVNCDRITRPEDSYKAICDIMVLPTKPRHEDARKLLQEIASQVQPIMIKHKWKTNLLSEFWPEQASLTGLNVKHGLVIKLRLRSADDLNKFITTQDILDTMLQQLCYNNYSSSDDLAFKNLLNDLRKEVEERQSTQNPPLR